MMKNVIEEIIAERQRQIIMEGFDSNHDDNHKHGELAKAAACYCLYTEGGIPPYYWPWDFSWWKPKTRRYDLLRAGALIVAEIERLDRKNDQ